MSSAKYIITNITQQLQDTHYVTDELRILLSFKLNNCSENHGNDNE
jgi:hypothetical protein